MPIRWRLLLSAWFAAVVPLCVLVVVITLENSKTVGQQTRVLHTTVANDIARVVEDEQERAELELKAVRRTLLTANLTFDERIAASLALVAASPNLDVLGIYGEDGALIDVMKVESALERTTRPLPETLSALLRDNARTHENDVVLGELHGDNIHAPTLPMVLHVKGNSQRSMYLVAEVSCRAVQERIDRLRSTADLNDVDSIFVLRDGHYMAHGDAQKAVRIESAEDEPVAKDILKLRLGATSAGMQTTTEATRKDGRVWVGSAVVAEDYAIIVQSPLDVVDAPIARLWRVAVVVALIALLAVALLALALSRRITRPLAALMGYARKIAAREFDAPMPAALLTGDELEELGLAMQAAGADLRKSERQLIEETRLREGLSRYVPSQLVDAFVEKKQDFKLTGERRRVTVMFADVCAFTPLSAKLPPEDLTALLNDLFLILTDLIWKTEGTVDKFIGDSVMAFWNAPSAQEDHAARALQTARDMMRFLEIGNARWHKKYGVKIELAIGIATGDVVVGNLGTERRLVYTVIGETVNIAARLESLAAPMQILVDGATIDRAGDDSAHPLGARTLAGVAHAVDVFALEV
jgi:adenylate cyclase